jgi:hypothetical protein
MQFDHIGLITQERHEGERFAEGMRLWITDYREHPYRVEWLRFEPDSTVVEPVRTKPHVAYRVENLAQAAQGLKVLVEPFDIGRGVVAFYQSDDGAVIELMQLRE